MVAFVETLCSTPQHHWQRGAVQEGVTPLHQACLQTGLAVTAVPPSIEKQRGGGKTCRRVSDLPNKHACKQESSRCKAMQYPSASLAKRCCAGGYQTSPASKLTNRSYSQYSTTQHQKRKGGSCKVCRGVRDLQVGLQRRSPQGQQQARHTGSCTLWGQWAAGTCSACGM